ncbi:MAG: plasmid partitioning protein, partial [Rhizobium pusense]|nr:plasmid partitioning protein [Agrobacterium pusense]
PIEDDMLLALLVLAFAGLNVRVDSGANDNVFGSKRFKRHAARLIGEDGKLAFDTETLRVAARSALIDVLSCRRGMSNSGVVSRIAGDAISADSFLPNMGGEDFLLCLSRQALEAAAKDANVLPRQKVRETRSALVDHFKEERFVHASALFAPDASEIADLLKHADELDVDEASADTDATGPEDDAIDGNPVAPDPENEDGGAVEDCTADEAPAADDDSRDPFDEDHTSSETFDGDADRDDPDKQDAYGIAAE